MRAGSIQGNPHPAHTLGAAGPRVYPAASLTACEMAGRLDGPWAALGAGLLLSLSACSLLKAPVSQSPHTTSPPPVAIVTVPLPALPTLPPPAVQPVPATPLPALVSEARSPKEYRTDAASHIYRQYQARIYKGKLPPLLKAVGVLEVSVNSQGQVDEIVWLRAPSHVPEVMREIENKVREAQPYPAPRLLKKVKYVDTWLWHASGQFQLDTLTEGQY